jgi:signal peptidase I
MSKKPNTPKGGDQKEKPKKEEAPATPPIVSTPGATGVVEAFFSKTFRNAKVMRKHVRKLVNHQRDILPAQDLAAIHASLAELDKAIAERVDEPSLEKAMENLGEAAENRIKPYPHAGYRENVEVFLVALAVAMGIRTFFLQPFKIPTGSMQPTLFGVTSTPDVYGHRGEPEQIDPAQLERPKGWAAVTDWFKGTSYIDIKAKVDGELEISPPKKIAIFSIYHNIKIGGVSHSLWFPPDYGGQSLEQRAGIRNGQYFKQGEQVVKMKIVNGDHLFVDRLTYNFRPPERGEIVVFETKGIPEDYRRMYATQRPDGGIEPIPADIFYIKRLVGIGPEKIEVGADRHLRINGKRLEASTPHFEKVYGFDPNKPPQDSHYSGHVGDTFQLGGKEIRAGMAPFFQGGAVDIPAGYCMMMGDNTMNSLDSRYWGYIPASSVIGKSFFVYWPLSERFGWGYHQ